MPNQRVVVKDLKEGRTPDPKYGKIAKLRSTHNNYLTLPVVFLMLSNHYPLAFATQYNWIIASLIFLTGVTIRHYFNTLHATGRGPNWTWIVTVLLFLLIAWLSTAPMLDDYDNAENRNLTESEQKFAGTDEFEKAFDVVLGNCSMCHAREPAWEGTLWPPKGVVLETASDVARNAQTIYLHAGITTAMPPPSAALTMDDASRAAIVAWYRSARSPN